MSKPCSWICFRGMNTGVGPADPHARTPRMLWAEHAQSPSVKSRVHAVEDSAQSCVCVCVSDAHPPTHCTQLSYNRFLMAPHNGPSGAGAGAAWSTTCIGSILVLASLCTVADGQTASPSPAPSVTHTPTMKPTE